MKANLKGTADKLEMALDILNMPGMPEHKEADLKRVGDMVTEAAVTLREIFVSFDEAMAQAANNTKQLHCAGCGNPVSSMVPEGTVVRAFIECPECIENHGKETLTLNRKELMDLRATYVKHEQRGKDLVEKVTREMRETTEKERRDKRIVREMYLYQQGKAAGMKEEIEEMFFKVDGFFPEIEGEGLQKK